VVRYDLLPCHRPLDVLARIGVRERGQRDNVLGECDVEEGLRDVVRRGGELWLGWCQ
jgi:hypothetical protein